MPEESTDIAVRESIRTMADLPSPVEITRAIAGRATEPLTDMARRSMSLLVDYCRGCSPETIALRYGVSVEQIQCELVAAVDDAMTRRDQEGFQKLAMLQLIDLDKELDALYKATPAVSHHRRQVIDRWGKKRVVKEEQTNLPYKVKLIQERRHNVLARRLILGTMNGEQGPASNDAIQSEIEQRSLVVLADVIRDVAGRSFDLAGDALRQISQTNQKPQSVGQVIETEAP